MDNKLFLEYAPIILIVVVFLIQQKLVVTPEQLEKKHREILEDADKKYTTKEAMNSLLRQFDDMCIKIDKIYNKIFENK